MKRKIFVNLVVSIILIVVLSGVVLVTVGGTNLSAFNTVDEVYYKSESENNKVSLAINIYWGTEYLDDMLDILDKYENVRVTFFIGGMWAAENNELLQRIAESKNEIANHGYFHKDHNKLTYEQNKEEILKTEKLIEGLCGRKTQLFMPPSGSYGNNTVKACKDLGYRVIMWSKDTIDWRDKNSDLIFKRATENVKSGDFILMHPTQHTLLAFEKILLYHINNGFELVTISENLNS